MISTTKRRLASLASASALIAMLAVTIVPGAALAAVNEVTPSTNNFNLDNGWAHVVVNPGPGSATVTFNSSRAFASCFEYRTDGTPQPSASNYNPLVTDGLYPFVCVNNTTRTETIPANNYIEVRMVFGGEADERFDWTRFPVLPKCTPTGFVRDGIDLTAAQIGGTVTGNLDAAGCNIGAYNPTSVNNANISGANYFGVVVNGISANVTGSSIHDIGESPLNGSQHGVGIYYTSASGTISNNVVSDYQKGGIVARDGGKVTISHNTVTGLGAVTFIAQNGIQVSFGTSARLFENEVSLNSYSPSKVTACGLLIYKAGGVGGESKAGISYIKTDNDFHNNETNICNFGKGGAGFSL